MRLFIDSAAVQVATHIQGSGDIFMYFSVVFPMVKNTALWLADNVGIRIIEAALAGEP